MLHCNLQILLAFRLFYFVFFLPAKAERLGSRVEIFMAKVKITLIVIMFTPTGNGGKANEKQFSFFLALEEVLCM